MLSRSKPQIPLRKETPPSLAEIAVPVTNTESIFLRAPTYLAPLIGTELWQILFDLNQFTAFVSYYRTRKNDLGPEKSASFEHWNSNLEYRLLSYLPPRGREQHLRQQFQRSSADSRCAVDKHRPMGLSTVD